MLTNPSLRIRTPRLITILNVMHKVPILTQWMARSPHFQKKKINENQLSVSKVLQHGFPRLSLPHLHLHGMVVRLKKRNEAIINQ